MNAIVCKDNDEFCELETVLYALHAERNPLSMHMFRRVGVVLQNGDCAMYLAWRTVRTIRSQCECNPARRIRFSGRVSGVLEYSTRVRSRIRASNNIGCNTLASSIVWVQRLRVINLHILILLISHCLCSKVKGVYLLRSCLALMSRERSREVTFWPWRALWA